MIDDRGSRRRGCGAALLVLSLAACGTRQSHAALEHALVVNGPVGSYGAAGAGGTSGAGSVAGGSNPGTTTTGAIDGSTGTGGGSTGGGGTGGGGNGGDRTGRGGGTSGGASGGSAGGSRDGTAAASAKCTGNERPLVIGAVGEQTGIVGAVMAVGPKMVSAWAASVNARGGLACHQVKYIVADDGGDPSRNAALTQQLVEQDHVVAFVHNDATLAWTGSENYLVSHNIPVIGTDASFNAVYSHPNFFPQATSGVYQGDAQFGAASTALTTAQKQAFGVLACQEISSCSDLSKDAPALARKFGLKLVYSGSVALSAPDYSAACNQAKSAGVKALLVGLDGNSMHRLTRSCSGVTFHPVIMAASVSTVPDFPSDPGLDGALMVTSVHPFTNTGNPAIAEMLQVIARYAPGLTPSGETSYAWASAQLLQYASQFFPAKATLTSADVLNAMDHVKNTTLGGLTVPLTFAKGQNAKPVVCWWVVTIQHGKWASAGGNRRSCA